MGDHLRIAQGSPPWKPAPDASLDATLHRFTHPLIGVIGQSGHQFAFWCAVGQNFDTNVWIYALLEEGDAALLQEATTREQLVERLRSITQGRGSEVALAGENGILLVATLAPGLTYGETVDPALEALRETIEDAKQGLDSLDDRESIPA